MKNTFYCGFHKGHPHVSNPDFEDGEVKLVELFVKRKDAETAGVKDIRKVRIFIVPEGEQTQADFDIMETYSVQGE